MMATMRLISSTPEAYHTYHFYRGDVGAMLPPKICYNQSINIFIANSQLSIYIYYTAKYIYIMLQKTGLLNFTQGSYKFYVGSPAGSHLSKLVATPAPVIATSALVGVTEPYFELTLTVFCISSNY